MTTNTRVSNWVFTLNNYTQVNVEHLMQRDKGEDKSWNYIIFGYEVGEEQTPHLQGYVEFGDCLTMGQAKKRLGDPRFHLEPRRGTQEQAVEYCKKDGDIFEDGVKATCKKAGQSHKNKALQYMDLIKQGRIAEIASDPDCSYNILKHVKDMAVLLEEPRKPDEDIEVRWYWGPTGTGKTRRAWYEANKSGKRVYVKSTNTKWFDGYDGEEVIIFDDLRSSWFEYSYLLKLLDRYPTQVECKGGSRQWKATTIYVTSCFKPDEMYSGMQERDHERDAIAQLVRRVHTTQHMPMTPFGCWTEPTEQ